MKIEISMSDSYTEVLLEGRLDANTSQELEKMLTDLLQKDHTDLLINFSGLNYISSSGLRVFLVAAKLLDEKGKKLNLCCMKDYVREVFDIAGFSVLFKIYGSRSEAVSQYL